MTTADTFGSIGVMWLTMAVRPTVAMTACKPSISGIHAASRDPNTSTRINSVSGIERSPACPSWSLNSFVSALSELTAPASSM